MLAPPETSEALISIPDFYRRAIPAAASVLLPPGAVGPVVFNWGAWAHVVGLLLIPDDGAETTLAKLAIEIFDRRDKALFTDGRGLTNNLQQPNAQPCLAMFGRAFRTFPLDRAARPPAEWRITVKNSDVASRTVAPLVFVVRDLPGKTTRDHR